MRTSRCTSTACCSSPMSTSTWTGARSCSTGRCARTASRGGGGCWAHGGSGPTARTTPSTSATRSTAKYGSSTPRRSRSTTNQTTSSDHPGRHRCFSGRAETRAMKPAQVMTCGGPGSVPGPVLEVAVALPRVGDRVKKLVAGAQIREHWPRRLLERAAVLPRVTRTVLAVPSSSRACALEPSGSRILAALIRLDAVAPVVEEDRAGPWERRLTSRGGTSGAIGRDDDRRLVDADAVAAERTQDEPVPLHSGELCTRRHPTRIGS